MASLAEIRARLQAAESRQGTSSVGGDNAIYPHWNMNEGDSALLRFLPDGDTNNTFFWVERAMIKLPFNGIKGEMDSKHTLVQVPCVEMWGDSCSILAEVRTWFKDASLEDMGRKYWKKRSYLFQGFVRENPISDDNTPANPIRRFIMGPQLFAPIKAALMDPELEELPTDYERGLDFRVSKTSKGGYADYNTSKWSRKETALTAEEAEAIQTHGLFNLSEFLPKKPNEEELRVMQEMFEASVNGEAYDPERWGSYFRPAGYSAPATAPNNGSGTVSTPVAEATPTPTPAPIPPVAESAAESAPVAEAPVQTEAPATNQKAEDILAMIRSRQKAD